MKLPIRFFASLSLGLAFAAAAAEDTRLAAALLKSATTEERCQLEVLQDLGWGITESSTTTAVDAGTGNICQTGSLEELAIAPQLRVNPEGAAADFEAIRKSFPKLLAAPQTFCTYKLRLGYAAKIATEKFAANNENQFTGFRLGFIKFRKTDSFRHRPWKWAGLPGKFIYYPKDDLGQAVEQFYSGKVRMDCAAGLMAMEMATTYELFGHDDFNRAFTSEEFPIGAFPKIEKSANVFHGKTAKLIGDSSARILPRQGAASLVGFSGYIGNVNGKSSLDNRANIGENFMIASVTPEAATALAKAGSFAKMNAAMTEAWKVVRASKNPTAEAMEIGNDMNSDRVDGDKSETHRMVDLILSGPEFTGIRTFVQGAHPGVATTDIRYHIKRLLPVNPRTPYAIRLYGSPVNGDFFERYKKVRFDSCMAASK